MTRAEKYDWITRRIRTGQDLMRRNQTPQSRKLLEEELQVMYEIAKDYEPARTGETEEK